ncbi:MAG: amidase, partial [Gemmatimonadetes bacterium]|nr:amidase [Gemmatimonadota bacterium]
PWDEEEHRVPGGSSSGAGVSLHEGSALIALGSDTGGSIRIPASATGVVGHKSTAGRWPTDGVVPLSTTLDTVGALTRTAEDAAYVLEMIDGCSVPEATLEGLRIGVPETSKRWTEADAQVAQVVKDALSELEALGVTLVPLEAPELDQATGAYLSSGIPSSECAAFLRRCLPQVPATLDPTVAQRLASALDRSAADYLDALAERESRAVAAAQRFEGIDLIATPTLPITPPTVASLEPLEAYFAANRRMLSNTCPVNYLGLCALSLPAGLDAEDMPVGLQLVAPGGEDARLLGWGRAVEKGLGSGHARLGTPPLLAGGAGAGRS